MNLPLVSVIIPNYCHAQYLNQRIDSVLNQTYDNIEVIILDDCSPDNSREVIDTYRNNPKVKHIIYNEQNSGSTFVQWYRGFSLAQGELIWIAESDDYCTKDFLECLVCQYINNPGTSIVYSHSQFVDADGNHIWTSSSESNHRESISKYDGKEYIVNHLLLGNDIRNASSAIFNKDALNGISNDYMNYKAAGDRLFWIYLAERGNVIITKERKNFFRQHVQKVSPSKLMDGTTFFENKDIYKYLCKNKYLSYINVIQVYAYMWYLIRTTVFDSPDIEKRVKHVWKYINFIPTKVLCWLYIR